MRLAELTLRRYGHFADTPLDFPAGPNDFHLLVGRNEAGKSTLRHAITDLLFGFPERTPWAFQFDSAELALEATLSHGTERLEVLRHKRRKTPLTRPTGEPLPDAALVPWLGGLERRAYEGMFSLDHDALREGGVKLLAGADDAGRQIFEASAGLTNLSRLKRALEEEADALWAKRRSGARSWYQAKDALDQAERERREATVTAQAHREARRRVESAAAALETANEALTALRLRQTRWNRVRRIAPRLAERAELEAQLAALGDVPAFPEDVVARTDAARNRYRLADEERKRHETLLRQALARRDQAVVDRRVLSQDAAIRALQARVSQTAATRTDLTQVQSERSANESALRRLAADLGWPEADPASLRRRLYTAPVRATLNDLLERDTTLRTELATAGRELRAATQALERLREQQARAPVPADVAPLRAALAMAEARREGVQAAGALARRIAAAEAKLANRSLELAPWTGTLAELRRLALPDAAALDRLEADLARTDEGSRRAHDDEQRARAELLAVETRLTELRDVPDLVPAEEIVRARAHRDALWSEIRAGRRGPADAGDDYEQRLRRADELVDGRLRHAEAASELDRQTGERQRRLAALAQAETARTDADATAAQARASWSAAIAPLPGTLAPATYRGWAARRAQLLADAEALDTDRAEALALREELAGTARALEEGLRTVGRPGSGPEADVPALAARAREVLEEHARQTRSLEALAAELAAAAAHVATRQSQSKAAAAQRDAWASEWAPATAAAHCPGFTPQQVRDALARMAEMATTLQRIDIGTERIAAMQAALDDLERLATGLSAALPREDGESVAAYSARWSEALDTHRQADSLRRAAERDAATARDALEKATAELRLAEASVAPLCAQAGVDHLTTLEAEVTRWKTHRDLAQRIHAITSDMLRDGDGLSLDALVAEVAAHAPDTASAQLEALDRQIDIQLADVRRAAAERETAEAALRSLEATGGAVDAEFARQQALARLTDATERYLQVRTAERVLHWAIEKFRAERQGPILSRASARFAQLTLGGFDRLLVDADGDTPVLKAHRTGGAYVDVTGLSEGTRDQLYLALRLAAVEQHVANAGALPFVADDLTVNFDEPRGDAALRALHELSQHMQVLFFTHHVFVVERAQALFGDTVRTIRLGPGATAA